MKNTIARLRRDNATFDWIEMLSKEDKTRLRVMVVEAKANYGEFTDQAITDIATKFEITKPQAHEASEWTTWVPVVQCGFLGTCWQYIDKRLPWLMNRRWMIFGNSLDFFITTFIAFTMVGFPNTVESYVSPIFECVLMQASYFWFIGTLGTMVIKLYKAAEKKILDHRIDSNAKPKTIVPKCKYTVMGMFFIMFMISAYFFHSLPNQYRGEGE